MEAPPIGDDELAVVAEVARREGWLDLARPPESHAPRSIAEERAVGRFTQAVPRRRSPNLALRARIGIVVLTVVVLGVCWWISPTRTAIGLIGAGIFSAFALRRARRREVAGTKGPARRSPWGRLRV